MNAFLQIFIKYTHRKELEIKESCKIFPFLWLIITYKHYNNPFNTTLTKIA